MKRFDGPSALVSIVVAGAILSQGCVVPREPAMAQVTPPSPPVSARPRVEDDPVYQAYVAERRKTHPAGQWQDSPPAKWADALERYEPRVKPGNQRALNSARGPFVNYIIHLHNRLHPIFTNEFLAWLDTLPSTDPRNDPQLAVRLEFAISGTDGHIVRMGVLRSSGVPRFDVAALDAVDQASPFGPAPAEILSSDGNVYFHWEFHRDPVLACSTINGRPYWISVD